MNNIGLAEIAFFKHCLGIAHGIVWILCAGIIMGVCDLVKYYLEENK